MAAAELYGHFELIRYLTAGGMADLYLARSPKHEGDLVVKKIQPRFIEFTRVVKMFIDEGRIAQALEHPNIVKIVDVGQESGSYYIAMEYIPGRDLLAICRRGVEVGHFMPRHLAVAILVQALRGLQHAHEKTGADGVPLRVVHCDISPGNIVVSWGGTVKIVDFGIARATIQLRNEDHSVAGKYNYMAPEQIRGQAIDQRADIFALGVILYELTVGKRLFRGRPEQVMKLVCEDPIAAPSTLRPDFPAELDRIIMKSLERDVEKRYRTARDLRDDLMVWLAEEGVAAGKRQVAEYLRAVFGADKVRDSDEFGAESAADDDLVLEKGLPTTESGLHELPLLVDPDEPEETSGVFRAHPPANGVAKKPAPSPSDEPMPTTSDMPTAPLPLQPPSVVVMPGTADENTRKTPLAPPPAGSSGALIIIAAAVVVVAAVLYFILRG